MTIGLPSARPLVGDVIATAGLVLGSPIVNTGSFVNDDGAAVVIGAGVQFRAAGGVSLTDYVLTVNCGTTLGNTRAVVCMLQVRDT